MSNRTNEKKLSLNSVNQKKNTIPHCQSDFLELERLCEVVERKTMSDI